MPRIPAPFQVKDPFAVAGATEMTAREVYLKCRRDGGFHQGSLVNPADWDRLVAAIRRLAKDDDLSASTHTQTERTWPRRSVRQVQVHKDQMLAFLD